MPWANTNGAIFGAIAGAATSGLVSLGGNAAQATKLIVPHKLPVSTDECYEKYGISVNYTMPVSASIDFYFFS